jgi:hypothetical protein
MELYNTNRLHDTAIQHYQLIFRQNGFVRLPNVLTPECADHVRYQLLQKCIPHEKDGYYQVPTDAHEQLMPILAPRIHQLIPGLLTGSKHQYKYSLFEINWKITDPGVGFVWHKDREHEGITGRQYQYPSCVHVAFFLENMGIDGGVTEFISGSHWHPDRGPSDKSYLCRPEISSTDALLFDQRTWHQTGNRVKPSLRSMGIFGIQKVQLFGDTIAQEMPTALRDRWRSETDKELQIFLGGHWSPESVFRK